MTQSQNQQTVKTATKKNTTLSQSHNSISLSNDGAKTLNSKIDRYLSYPALYFSQYSKLYNTQEVDQQTILSFCKETEAILTIQERVKVNIITAEDITKLSELDKKFNEYVNIPEQNAQTAVEKLLQFEKSYQQISAQTETCGKEAPLFYDSTVLSNLLSKAQGKQEQQFVKMSAVAREKIQLLDSKPQIFAGREYAKVFTNGANLVQLIKGTAQEKDALLKTAERFDKTLAQIEKLGDLELAKSTAEFRDADTTPEKRREAKQLMGQYGVDATKLPNAKVQDAVTPSQKTDAVTPSQKTDAVTPPAKKPNVFVRLWRQLQNTFSNKSKATHKTNQPAVQQKTAAVKPETIRITKTHSKDLQAQQTSAKSEIQQK